MTIRNLGRAWPGCTWTPNENSGKLQRLCIQASKILGTINFSGLVCNFSSNSSCGLQQRQLQLSCINRIVLLFSFLYRHHLAVCLSPTNNISLSHTEFREIFFHFHHQGTLLFIPNRATSHLASSSRRNFGTRSLNNENSEVAYSTKLSNFLWFLKYETSDTTNG